MQRSILVATIELVDTDSNAEPEYPPLQIRVAFYMDEVSLKAESKPPNIESLVYILHLRLLIVIGIATVLALTPRRR